MSDANKPQNCAAEFTTLQKAYNKIVNDYTNLPTMLKNDGVERVEFGFEETDIGSTDLTDSKSMCAFAQKLVTSLQKTEGFHKKRLEAARYLVCTKVGAMLKAKMTSKLVNCLVQAKREAYQAGDSNAIASIQNDIDKFNKNGLKRISKLFLVMKDKCLMKDAANSQGTRVLSVFKSTLKASVRKKAGGVMAWGEKVAIAEVVNYAVSVHVPDAKNIVTNFKTEETDDPHHPGLHQASGTILDFVTTYDLDAPGTVGEILNISYGADYEIYPGEAEIEPISASVAVTGNFQPIDTQVPSGHEQTTTTTTTTATATADGKDDGCAIPEEASVITCKKDHRTKLTAACDNDLIKRCIRNDLQDCSDLPSASAQTCKRTAIKQFLSTKPECYTKATTQCRTFLSRVDDKPAIPTNCISWFDGCNDCIAKDGQAGDCTQNICKIRETAFCKVFQDGKQCRKSWATGKSTCDGDNNSTDSKNNASSEEACEDVISDFELSKEEVCKRALYKCTDNHAVVESCNIQRRDEEVTHCSATTDKAKQRSCCVQDKLVGPKCDGYGSSQKLPSDCKTRCVAQSKFKSEDKSCRSCRGAGNVRLEGVSDDIKTMQAFDPARVETTIKEVASRLNKVFVCAVCCCCC